MSKQLAISSTFSIFAMACMALLGTQDNSAAATIDAPMTIQAETPNLDLNRPNFLP